MEYSIYCNKMRIVEDDAIHYPLNLEDIKDF